MPAASGSIVAAREGFALPAIVSSPRAAWKRPEIARRPSTVCVFARIVAEHRWEGLGAVNVVEIKPETPQQRSQDRKSVV